MPAFAKVVDDPVEALVAVGKENTELHDELITVYHEMDLYRDCLAEITRIQTSDPGEAFDKAKMYAEAALSGQRMPGWATARVHKMRPS